MRKSKCVKTVGLLCMKNCMKTTQPTKGLRFIITIHSIQFLPIRNSQHFTTIHIYDTFFIVQFAILIWWSSCAGKIQWKDYRIEKTLVKPSSYFGYVLTPSYNFIALLRVFFVFQTMHDLSILSFYRSNEIKWTTHEQQQQQQHVDLILIYTLHSKFIYIYEAWGMRTHFSF